jgi:hypothetical protein
VTPVLFHVVVYGEDVRAKPMFVLPTSNRTFATAILSEAVAVSVTDEPETVAPLAGTVSEMDGGVASDVSATFDEAPPMKMIWPGEYPGNGELERPGVGEEVAVVVEGVKGVEGGVVASAALSRARVFGPTLPTASRL